MVYLASARKNQTAAMSPGLGAAVLQPSQREDSQAAGIPSLTDSASE